VHHRMWRIPGPSPAQNAQATDTKINIRTHTVKRYYQIIVKLLTT
jgi:hypothetical protein